MNRAVVVVWNLLWPAFASLALVVALTAVAAHACGCTPSARMEALTAMTKAATPEAASQHDQIAAEEAACLKLEAYAERKACVVASREKHAAVLAALRTLLAVDDSALEESIDFPSAIRAYCALTDAIPTMPALPALLGSCP